MRVTPTGVSDAVRILQSNRYFPISQDALSPKFTVGRRTGFPVPPYNNNNTRQVNKPVLPAADSGSDTTPASPSFASIAAGDFRTRTNSFKRKNLEVSPNTESEQLNRAKSARTEGSFSFNVMSAIEENTVMLEQVTASLSEASSSDHLLVSIMAKLCDGMTSQNNLIRMLFSEVQCTKVSNSSSSMSHPTITIEDDVDSEHRYDDYPRLQAENVRRRPLQQQPLGGESWKEHWGRRNQKERRDRTREAEKSAQNNKGNNDLSSQKDLEAEKDKQVQQGQQDPFTQAVREAEKSVVVYNLDLGQSPTMNPSTISSKVTAALITAVSCSIEGNHPAIAGDMVNDLLSLVKGMDIFGKCTKPCRDPKDPSKNGKFYTVPVKLSFSSKQVAKHVNEILRQKYKVSTSIPYHKTLKSAITLAHEKIRNQNPGMQVLISLDAPKKVLKPFFRPPPTRSSRSGPSNWETAGNPIPLPAEALDPKIRNTPEGFSISTSPVLQNPKDRSARQTEDSDDEDNFADPFAEPLVDTAKSSANMAAASSLIGLSGDNDKSK